MKVYLNGTILDAADAAISVLDHGLLYGDGVFEGIRIYGGKVFKLREHVERLFASAKAIMLTIPISIADMEKAILDTVAASGLADGYIRPIVTRGTGCLGIDPVSCEKPSIIIIVGTIQLYPEECYRKGIEIVSLPTRRVPSECLDPRIKSLNYLNNVLAKIEARQAGCKEGVMLNTAGQVAECTADNIFIVKHGALLTPAPQCGALDGITMRTVCELAESLSIRVTASVLSRYDLYTADECFLTGTGAELIPVTKIDGRTIGSGEPGPVTQRLIKAFHDYVKQ
ncbi:MAG: branched-chain-amino-acid transaminase [Nitrospiraceae bacterium]|jgi:branched-chain amino acid aminotransferase|nr:branched-chain-amino-acid transaminase [Nitrospiraceae bacterium]